MKRSFFTAFAVFMVAASAVAQTMDQKKICAVKWAVQQAVYNKPCAKEIKSLDVHDFKSAEQMKATALSKITDEDAKKEAEKNASKALSATDNAGLEKAVRSALDMYQKDCSYITKPAEKHDEVKPVDAPEEELDINKDNQEEVAEASKPADEGGKLTPEATATEENGEDGEAAVTELPEEEDEDGLIAGLRGESIGLIIFISLLFNAIIGGLLYLATRYYLAGKGDVDRVRYRHDAEIKNMSVKLSNLETLVASLQRSVNQKPGAASRPVVLDTPEPATTVQSAPERVEPSAIEKTGPAADKDELATVIAVDTPEEGDVETAIINEPADDEPTKPATITLDVDDVPVAAAPAAEPTQLELPLGQPVSPNNPLYVFFSTPTAEGVFKEVSEKRQVGRSIYVLQSTDGRTGKFVTLPDQDAVATALLSLSHSVKPVCQITNNIADPNNLVTETPGEAVLENGVWKVTKKAVVALEK